LRVADEKGVRKKIINIPNINEIMAGTAIGSILEIPDNSIVFISLLFCIFTKKSVPENKKINIESSIIVVVVFAKVRMTSKEIKFSNFLSFKYTSSPARLIKSTREKKTKKTTNKEDMNSLDKYLASIDGYRIFI
jgi:hypothetical protein